MKYGICIRVQGLLPSPIRVVDRVGSETMTAPYTTRKKAQNAADTFNRRWRETGSPKRASVAVVV